MFNYVQSNFTTLSYSLTPYTVAVHHRQLISLYIAPRKLKSRFVGILSRIYLNPKVVPAETKNSIQVASLCEEKDERGNVTSKTSKDHESCFKVLCCSSLRRGPRTKSYEIEKSHKLTLRKISFCDRWLGFMPQVTRSARIAESRSPKPTTTI